MEMSAKYNFVAPGGKKTRLVGVIQARSASECIFKTAFDTLARFLNLQCFIVSRSGLQLFAGDKQSAFTEIPEKTFC